MSSIIQVRKDGPSTSLSQQIKGFYQSKNNLVSDSADLLYKVSVVRMAWEFHSLDRLAKVQLPQISQALIGAVRSPADLDTIFPLMIACKAEIIDNKVYLPEIIRNLLETYKSHSPDTLENRTKLFEFLRKVIENELINPYNKWILNLIFQYVINQEPLDIAFADFVLAQNPAMINTRHVDKHKLLGKLYIENLPLTQADLVRADYLISRGADLAERVTTETAWTVEWEIPLVVLAAKEGLIPFLMLMIPHLKREHTCLTGVLGRSAYYYLKRGAGRVPPELLDAFRPPNQGIPNALMSYLDGVPSRKWFRKIEHSKTIQQFISMVNDTVTYKDMDTFLQATLVLLIDFPIVNSEEDCAGIKQLFHFALAQFTNITPFATAICSGILEHNKTQPQLAENLVVSILDVLSPQVCNDSCRVLILKSLERYPEGRGIIDKMYQKVGNTLIDRIVFDVHSSVVRYLHEKGAVLSNAFIKKLLSSSRTEMLSLILEHPERYEDTFEAGFIFSAQKKRLYDLANGFLEAFGDKIFPRFYALLAYLKEIHLGVSDRHFDRIIADEIQYVRDATKLSTLPKKMFMFDKGFLGRISKEFIDFWEGRSQPPEDIFSRLDAFPYRGSINYLRKQKLVWDLFQNDERMKDFPISEIWRFAIDSDKEDVGPFAFEQEPGYLNSFLEGMFYALSTASAPKTPDWYYHLHAQIVGECSTPQIHGLVFNAHLRSWDATHADFMPYQTDYRTDDVDWGISTLDKDPIGMQDIRSNRFWKLNGTKILCATGCNPVEAYENTKLELTLIMHYFQRLFDQAGSRAKRLIVTLAWVRELEIHHFFADANGRSSHLALVSMIAGQKDLPFFLLPDPNILDCNGPESLAYRYLEGCVNFRKGGVGIHYTSSSSVKQLEYLNLMGHEDLQVLAEELKPLVVGKMWSEVIPLPTKETLV